MTTEPEISGALDAIERHESRFLAWGITDRALDRSSLERLASEGGGDADEVIRALTKRKLLFEVPRSAPPRYRSRMAEGIRLFANLRQQFENLRWETAARLVADFRLVIRPRRFPARVVSVDAVHRRLGGEGLPDVACASSTRCSGAGPDHRRATSPGFRSRPRRRS